MTTPSRGRASARASILKAARRLALRAGAAGLSVGDVAVEAGVSKALVLYHFHEKDALLAALVDDVGGDVLRRAEAPLDDASAPLDAHWAWLSRELDEGDIHVLATLATCDSAAARAVWYRVDAARRIAAAEHIGQVFARLRLSPRMPTALLAETMQAFVDGLVSRRALGVAPDARAAYDVLWLALLTLLE